ncbi:MAG: TonB-dependent siderophore receptor [Pseudomonadota bacterium]|nr:TonB-dependent siderophore receptor [Pseudomonadota bacterium]
MPNTVKLLPPIVLILSMLLGAAPRAADVQQDKPVAGGDEQPVVLPVITVTADPSNEIGYVATQSTTATKTDSPLIETPQSISVITSDRLEAQDADSLSEALRYTPGIQAEPFGFEPRFTFFNIRGFDATTTGLYRDGLQLRNPGFAGSFSLEPYGAERIEVPRGPASVLYGQGSPGGLVNFVSKRPAAKPFAEVEFETGNFNRLQGAFDLSGPITRDGTFLGRLTGLARDSDTQVDFIEDDRVFVAPSFTWRPSGATTLTLLGEYKRDETLSSQALPAAGTLFDNPNGSIPTRRFTGEPDVDRYDREDFSAAYLFEHQASDAWTFRQNARYYSNDLDNVAVFSSGLDGDQRTLNRSLFDGVGELDGFAIDTQAQLEWATGSASHTLLLGLDYQNIETSVLQAFGAAPSIDVFDPVYGAPVPTPPVFNDSDTDQQQIGLYVQDQIKFYEKFVVLLGGRYDWAETETEDNLVNTTTDQGDNELTGRAGLLYLFDNGLAPYASYSESFLPAAGTDASGRPFEPETGRQYEVGVKYQPPGANSFVTLALFELTRENFIQFDPATFLQVQTGEVRSRGIELEGVASFDFGLDLIASYAYLDIEITESSNPAEVGQRPMQTAEHTGSLWANYTIQRGSLNGLGLGFGVRYLGSNFGDNLNTIEAPPETLADAAIHYDWNKFRFAVNAKNVFDKEHVATCFVRGVGFCTFGQTRTVTASIGYRW